MLRGFKNLQDRVYANKVKKGFNVTDISREFDYTRGELQEAETAYNDGMETVGEELADTTIYLMGLASILGYDLGKEIERKVAINEGRIYLNDSKKEPVVCHRIVKVASKELKGNIEKLDKNIIRRAVNILLNSLSGIHIIDVQKRFIDELDYEDSYIIDVYDSNIDDLLCYLSSVLFEYNIYHSKESQK